MNGSRVDAQVERLTDEGVEVDSSGVLPVALPTDEAQVQTVLARAAADELRVIPTGRSSKLAWCRPETRANVSGGNTLLLSTRRLDAILDHVPGDGTITAQVGCCMDRLGETVAGGGHTLSPAVAGASRATLGGVLGAGLSGCDRIRSGPLRHHVLGMRIALADGTLAKSGGKLVKNVTGFDLHRLYTGSRGTLCVMLEASLRLLPAPELQRVLTTSSSECAPLLEAAAGLRALPIGPLALTLENAGQGGWRLHLALAGMGARVEREHELAGAVLPRAEVHEDAAARSALAQLVELELEDGLWPHARVLTTPSRCSAVLDVLTGNADVPAPRLVVQLGVASVGLHVAGLSAEPHATQTSVLEALATRLHDVGARLEPMAVSPETHLALAPDHDRQPALRWMQALADELDPHGRFRSPTFPGRR